MTAGLGISPYPEKQARPAKGGPSMEWPQGGTPEESCPAYRGPVPNRHGITAGAKRRGP